MPRHPGLDLGHEMLGAHHLQGYQDTSGSGDWALSIKHLAQPLSGMG